jgi:hypothetical protein
LLGVEVATADDDAVDAPVDAAVDPAVAAELDEVVLAFLA